MLSVMFIAAALSAHVTGESGTEEYIAPRLEIRNPDGDLEVIGSPWHVGWLIAPMTSHSELVPRTGVRNGEIEIGVSPGNMVSGVSHIQAIVGFAHDRNDEVWLADGKPHCFGRITAPKAIVSATGADLATIARRDDNVIRGGTLRVMPPDEHGGKVAIFGAHQRSRVQTFPGWRITVNGVAMTLRADCQSPILLDASSEPIAIELGDALVDAILFAGEPENEPEWVGGAHLVAEAQDDLRGDRSDGPSRAFARRPLTVEWGNSKAPVLPSDGEVRPPPNPKHRHRMWYAIDGELPADRSITFMIRMQGRPIEPDEAGPAPHLRDHDPRTLVRRDTVDLSDYTAIDSPESLVEVTLAAGLGTFVHFEGPREQLDIRPTMGPGAAWGDVNGDGWLDLVLLQGAGREGCDPLSDRLYLGGEGGVFTDATATAGLGRGDAGMGALLVDIDGDGDLDLYCANYGRDRLFLNNGDATFTDKSDLLPNLDLWSASVTAADPDGDGDLDLYITSYLDYDPAKMPPADELGRYQREDPIEMLPFAFPGQRNVYLRNTLARDGESEGELGFEDATEELGLLDVQGRGMQAVFWDFDRDGHEDLYVANDVSYNVLFRNQGDGTFKDVSFSTGLDDPRGGMGLAVGDVDGDGDEDVFLTNWQLEANALYLNGVVSNTGRKRRRASFHDATVKSGIGPTGIGKTSWGAEFFDLELDGDLDLYVANGYTSPDYESTGICVGQTNQLFVGDGRGKLKEACVLGRRAFSLAFASRGAIGADHDRDGDIDILVTANNGRVTLLRNDAVRQGHWLGVRLTQPGLNRNAIGAVATVTTSDGRSRRQTLRAGTGYLTGNAPELHFGLGPVEAITSITVEWPDGEATTHTAELDTWVTLSR